MARLLLKQSARPEASSRARRLVQAITPDLSPEERGDLALLVTELVNNGVRHANGRNEHPVMVDVLVCEHRIRVEVRDGGDGFARPDLPDRGEERASGWGLFLVDALADQWGVDPTQAVVWVEVRRN